MNILFYTLASKRSRDIESQAIEFSKHGHSIFLLTQSAHSVLHDNFRSRGFFTEFRTTKRHSFLGWVFSELYHLSLFCRKHKIDLVYSHLEPCNLIASLCQYTNPAVKFVLYRHHADALEFEANKRGRWLSKQVYKLARQVITVSENAKAYMVEKEKINPAKISVIPLAFNFDLYDLPAEKEVQLIKDQYNDGLLICTVGRLTSLKRFDLLIKVISLLKKEQLNAKLLILGTGEEDAYLKNVAEREGVEGSVYFLGFVENVLPYMAAADIYVHLSISEASCTVVKEAGLVSTPVIVCNNVGDFNEYIVNGINGWMVDKDDPIPQTVKILRLVSGDRSNLMGVGRDLKKTIYKHFDIGNVVDRYAFFERKE